MLVPLVLSVMTHEWIGSIPAGGLALIFAYRSYVAKRAQPPR